MSLHRRGFNFECHVGMFYLKAREGEIFAFFLSHKSFEAKKAEAELSSSKNAHAIIIHFAINHPPITTSGPP